MFAGVVLAIVARAALVRFLAARFRRDLRALNRGDYGPLLRAYADNAVLRFNEGPHRWSGEHRGRAAIERFLQDFTAARLQGEIRDVWIAGPPWALTLVARFDDESLGPDGQRLYANRVVIVARTRWGKIVEQEDFYEDTARILVLDQRLRELGVEPVAAAAGS